MHIAIVLSSYYKYKNAIKSQRRPTEYMPRGWVGFDKKSSKAQDGALISNLEVERRNICSIYTYGLLQRTPKPLDLSVGYIAKMSQ